ncbi:mechanosensitive ion channel family protein [Novacetimonas pomaceti]|uniref:Mechanosensitive ion channel protein MscS n=1 Tax=Novacetimonas pomaceti TaxID=2021998 RepID=A0ABX5P2W7_9PROT|nr:mechanosensitive ion channel family protein [Novacetimonas pomaceti]MBV1834072.1 mechanosensitive ion channel family protein [Novacetimonas pomaceti]PYD48097.1 mechanosensitive ion channel protein MscS [Novacetimonas pomaceti]
MKNEFLTVLTDLRHLFGWLPGPVASILMLCAAGLMAELFSRFFTKLILRIPGQKRGAFIRSFTMAMQRPARIMLVVLFVGTALPVSGLPYEMIQATTHTLLVLFVLMLGYAAIVATRILSEAYLVRINDKNDKDDILLRTHMTQVRMLRRTADLLIGLITVGASLMTFEPVRQYGLSLFASAGAASLVVGLAARPLLTNLFAGMQIAMTQPIRMEDLIIINGDWAWVEEITSTYVVLRVWDWRRHIVPISYFLENTFQNWTHNSAALIGVVFLYVDFHAPMDRIRERLREIVHAAPLWDGKVFDVQVADCNAQVMTIRVIASARSAMQSWDLRCEIREQIIAFLRDECPEALPRERLSHVASVSGLGGMPDPGMISPPIDRPPPGSYPGPGSIPANGTQGQGHGTPQ